MSTAAAAADAAPPPKGKKKLILIVAAVVVLALVGAGAFLMLKKKPAEEGEEGAEGDHAPAKAAVAKKHDPKAAPTFVPLEPFTVNLADRDAERYAQVGITLEVEDPHLADTIKQYMPAIRNNILLALADKTASQLQERDGKTKLAEQVRRETARAMGYEVEDPEDEEDAAKADDAPKKKAKKKKKAEAPLPVTAVHFSNFIIQ